MQMKLYVEIDFYAQVIDVPAHIIEKREYYRNKFLDWIYNPKVKHPYREVAVDASGKFFVAMVYDGQAFVDWLNRKVLKGTDEAAVMLEPEIEIGDRPWVEEGLPYIFF